MPTDSIVWSRGQEASFNLLTFPDSTTPSPLIMDTPASDNTSVTLDLPDVFDSNYLGGNLYEYLPDIPILKACHLEYSVNINASIFSSLFQFHVYKPVSFVDFNNPDVEPAKFGKFVTNASIIPDWLSLNPIFAKGSVRNNSTNYIPTVPTDFKTDGTFNNTMITAFETYISYVLLRNANAYICYDDTSVTDSQNIGISQGRTAGQHIKNLLLSISTDAGTSGTANGQTPATGLNGDYPNQFMDNNSFNEMNIGGLLFQLIRKTCPQRFAVSEDLLLNASTEYPVILNLLQTGDGIAMYNYISASNNSDTGFSQAETLIHSTGTTAPLITRVIYKLYDDSTALSNKITRPIVEAANSLLSFTDNDLNLSPAAWNAEYAPQMVLTATQMNLIDFSKLAPLSIYNNAKLLALTEWNDATDPSHNIVKTLSASNWNYIDTNALSGNSWLSYPISNITNITGTVTISASETPVATEAQLPGLTFMTGSKYSLPNASSLTLNQLNTLNLSQIQAGNGTLNHSNVLNALVATQYASGTNLIYPSDASSITTLTAAAAYLPQKMTTLLKGAQLSQSIVSKLHQYTDASGNYITLPDSVLTSTVFGYLSATSVLAIGGGSLLQLQSHASDILPAQMSSTFSVSQLEQIIPTLSAASVGKLTGTQLTTHIAGSVSVIMASLLTANSSGLTAGVAQVVGVIEGMVDAGIVGLPLNVLKAPYIVSRMSDTQVINISFADVTSLLATNNLFFSSSHTVALQQKYPGVI